MLDLVDVATKVYVTKTLKEKVLRNGCDYAMKLTEREKNGFLGVSINILAPEPKDRVGTIGTSKIRITSYSASPKG